MKIYHSQSSSVMNCFYVDGITGKYLRSGNMKLLNGTSILANAANLVWIFENIQEFIPKKRFIDQEREMTI